MAAMVDHIVHEGQLNLHRENRNSLKHVLLFQDRIEIYKDEAEATKKSPPIESIPISEVLHFWSQDEGFLADLSRPSEPKLDLRIVDEKDRAGWSSALGQVVDLKPKSAEAGKIMASGRKSVARSDEVLCEGPLSIMRSGTTTERFFRLLEDHLEYYQSEEEASSGQDPRGQVAIVEVKSWEVQEDGFLLQLSRKNLELKAAAGDKNKWETSFEKAFHFLRPPPRKTTTLIHSGDLAIRRKDVDTSRHFKLYRDRLEYFSSADDANQGAEPRGSMSLADVSQVQETQDGGFLVSLKQGKSLELRVPKPEDKAIWHRALSEVLDVKDAETSPAAVKDAEKSRAASEAHADENKPGEDVMEDKDSEDTRSSGGSSEKSDASAASPGFVGEGMLGLNRKGTLSKRFFRLGDDGLEYFASAADAELSSERRGHIAKSDVTAFEFQADGFMLQFGSEHKQIILSAEQGDVEKWTKWFHSVFEEIIAATKAVAKAKTTPAPAPLCESVLEAVHRSVTGGKTREKVSRMFFKLFKDRIEEFKVEKDAPMGAPSGTVKITDIKYIKGAEPAPNMFTLHMEGEAKQEPLLVFRATSKKDFDMWISQLRTLHTKDGVSLVQAPETHKSQPEVPKGMKRKPMKNPEHPLVLCEGPLHVEKNSKGEVRHCMLHEDRFEYYAEPVPQKKQKPQAEPRGRIAIGDISSLTVAKDSMRLSLGDKELSLVPTKTEDALMWANAWNKIFDLDISALKDATPSPSAAESTRGPSAASSDAGQEPALKPARPGVLVEGELGLEKGANVKPKYALLYQDRLDMYNSVNDIETGTPYGRVVLADVLDLELMPSGFSIQLPDRKLVLKTSAEDLPLWEEALGKVLGGDAASSDAGPTPELMGSLAILRKGGRTELRHFALWKDRLEYWRELEDAENGEEPRGKLRIPDIEDFQAVDWDRGFVIVFKNMKLQLQALTHDDFNHWREALTDVIDRAKDASKYVKGDEVRFLNEQLGSSDHGVVDATVLQIGNDGSMKLRHRNGEQWVDYAQLREQVRHAPSPMVRPSICRPREYPLHQGSLCVKQNGRVSPIYLTLYKDRLEYHSKFGDFAKGQLPVESIALSKVRHFKVVGGGLTIITQDGSLDIRADNHADLETWTSLFEAALTPGGMEEWQKMHQNIIAQNPARCSMIGMSGGHHTARGRAEPRGPGPRGQQAGTRIRAASAPSRQRTHAGASGAQSAQFEDSPEAQPGCLPARESIADPSKAHWIQVTMVDYPTRSGGALWANQGRPGKRVDISLPERSPEYPPERKRDREKPDVANKVNHPACPGRTAHQRGMTDGFPGVMKITEPRAPDFYAKSPTARRNLPAEMPAKIGSSERSQSTPASRVCCKVTDAGRLHRSGWATPAPRKIAGKVGVSSAEGGG